MPQHYRVMRLAIHAAGWTPIVVPFYCSRVELRNLDPLNAQRVRSDPDDGGSEDDLPPNATHAIVASGTSFDEGTQIAWLRSTVGTGPVVLRFVV